MRRLIAVFFVLLIAFYAGASQLDRCEESPDQRGQVCHILCSDGCATAPLPVAPSAPPADDTPKPVYGVNLVRPILSLDLEPETAPPRA